MAANILLPLWILLSCVIGALAETCYGADESITCIFGCCEDELYVYCCLSNGAGIGIICGCLVVVLSCIGACCRHARRRNNLNQATVKHNTQAASVAVVTNTANQGAYGNQQMSQYPPPAYPEPQTTPPYPVAPAAYPPKY
ncbi:uncharacterized protein LOC124265522 isoform X1 [Haliotis rubra]|uniref:uncharacterized protein LOC124265522 isoform X1 n=1 Tax=Haliotis rubra TaxID=36100 RepID=UPI001EE62234|nr:uncharacterized protein LOC124265522 isoform X1 [Haliotis rubra]